MRIFVSGFSGVGKSSFTKTASELFGLSVIDEVIRHNQNMSQFQYLTKYINIHKDLTLNHYICDRTFVDTIIWNRYELKDEFLNIPKPDIVIIPPVPSIVYILNNIGIWLNCPVRASAYNKKYSIDCYDISTEEFAGLLYSDFLLEINLMRIYYNKLKWNYFKISYDKLDYHNWQNTALIKLKEFIVEYN